MKQLVIEHRERKAPPVRSNGDGRLIRKVTRHVERHLGAVHWVFHDLYSDTVHVDLLWIAPGPGASFHTFVTCGMSEKPMLVTDQSQDTAYSELLLRLPADWALPPDSEDACWPLHELEHLARLPHVYHCALWQGHTVANGTLAGGPEPLAASTRFCGSVLLSPDWTPARFRRLRVDRRRKVRFFSVIPLYAEELQLAVDHGTAALLDHLTVAGVTDLVDPRRPNLLANATRPGGSFSNDSSTWSTS